MIIRACGVDMAFANMGLAAVEIEIGETTKVRGLDLTLVCTDRQDKKAVRKSSDDLRRARILAEALGAYARGHAAQIAFAEVPSGSQSASAARALGIAVGVLGSCPVPIVEVSPMEVKKLFSPGGKRKVPKTEIIAWAMRQWPQLPWLKHAGKTTMANEHLADAMAIVIAGISTPEFKQIMAIHHETPGPLGDRPSLNRRALYGI